MTHQFIDSLLNKLFPLKNQLPQDAWEKALLQAKEANYQNEPYHLLELNPDYTEEESTTPRKGDWIQSFLGNKIYPLDMKASEVDIRDIAHALSNKCRWSGMCHEFWSVAQHSWYVSYLCKPENAAHGLLHDASEAYLVDMPTPLKLLPEFAWFRELENQVQSVVCDRFQLSYKEPDDVKYADRVMLLTERRDFHINRTWQRIHKHKPLEVKLESWTPKQAEELFLERAIQLGLT